MNEILRFVRRVHIGRWAVLAATAILVASSIHIIPAGHRGVKFNALRGVVPHSYGEGIALRIPFVESFEDMEVRINKVEGQASAASKDLQ
ncbi:MAG: hypothetical protein ACREJQ_08715, partial [bacterium]